LRLRSLYNSPVPLLIALTLLLLPFALLLRMLLQIFRRPPAVHAAELLRVSSCPRVRNRRRQVLWELQGKSRFLVVMLLFFWGYCDLTASAILAPPDFTTATVRLYNLMHYGQSAALSAMVCVVFALPALLIVAAAPASRIVSRLMAHG